MLVQTTIISCPGKEVVKLVFPYQLVSLSNLFSRRGLVADQVTTLLETIRGLPITPRMKPKHLNSLQGCHHLPSTPPALSTAPGFHTFFSPVCQVCSSIWAFPQAIPSGRNILHPLFSFILRVPALKSCPLRRHP